MTFWRNSISNAFPFPPVLSAGLIKAFTLISPFILTSFGPQEFHGQTINMTANWQVFSSYAFLLLNRAVRYEVVLFYLLVQHQWMHVMLNDRGWVPTPGVQSLTQNDKYRWRWIWIFSFFFIGYLSVYQKETEGGEEVHRKSTILIVGKESQRRSLSIVLASPKARQATQTPPLPTLYEAVRRTSNLDFQWSGYALLTEPEIRPPRSSSAIWQS